MGFRLVPISMTLNDIERRNSPYFAFFLPNSIALQANYVTVVEDRPTMFVKILSPCSSFPLLAKTNTLLRGRPAAGLVAVCYHVQHRHSFFS